MTSTNMAERKGKGKGKQKIEIKKIEDTDRLTAAFSRRRIGLFKKASRLCVQCGAEIAIIVFAPSRKIFVFEHPSVDKLVNCFLERGLSSSRPVLGHIQMQQLGDLGRLDAEEEEEEEEMVGGDERGVFWWDKPVEDMGFNDLEQLILSLEELKKKAVARAEEMNMMKMMRESDPSNTMVEYAATPQEYNSSIMNMMMMENGPRNTMVEYTASSQEYNYSSSALHAGHDLVAHGVPDQSSDFEFGFDEPQQGVSNPSGAVHGHDSTSHGVPQGPGFGLDFSGHPSQQYNASSSTLHVDYLTAYGVPQGLDFRFFNENPPQI